MPTLVAPAYGSALVTEAGAHHYRFIGVEIRPAANTFVYNLVLFGSDTEPVLANFPHHLIIDRSYLHGDPVAGTRRGVALNSRDTAIIDSYLADFKEAGADTQAICGWNAAGPFKIVNNYLEAAGENVMFGGADPAVSGLVPADIELRHNTIAKNPAWKPKAPTYDGSRWTIKNLLELKNARRVLIEGNLFEEQWESAQTYALVLTPRNSGTAPWSTVEDVTIRYNWIRRVWSVLAVSGFDEYHPSQ